MTFMTRTSRCRARSIATLSVLVGAVALGGCSASAPSGDSAATASSSAGTSSTGDGAASSTASLPPGKQTPTGSQKWKTERIGVGRRLVTELHGKASGVTMKVHVWLPPQYDDPAYAGQRFPVIMAFPGGSGVTGAIWFSQGQPKIIADGAKAGTVTPFVLVEPQMQLSDSKDTECTDLPGQPKVGTFFEDDVTALVKSSFNVLPQKQAWGVTGVSSGGYCAARVPMHRPDLFSSAAVLDGYFRIDSPLAGAQTAEGKASSPIELITKDPTPDIRMQAWYGTGWGNDQISKERVEKFAALVRPPMIFTQKEVPGGSHTWDSYRKLMPEVFAWFTQYLAKPSSGS